MSHNPQDGKSSRFALFKDVAELIFAAVLAGYGVGGYYLLRDQMNIMQRQTEDAKRAAQDADKVTDRQLKIAESQAASLKALAEANQRTIALHERAHITVFAGSVPIDPISATHPTMQQQPLSARIVLSGDGPRPARKVGVIGAAEVLKIGTKPDINRTRVLLRNGTVTSTYVVLRPDFRYINGSKVGPVQSSLIDDLKAHRSRLLVYGKTTYSGSAGDCFYHEFCFEYAVLSNSESPEWLPCAKMGDEGECGK